MRVRADVASNWLRYASFAAAASSSSLSSSAAAAAAKV